MPSSSASQIHYPKMKVDPVENIMLSRSIELSDANPPKAPTWRASCQCFTTDSLPRGYPGQLFGLRRMQNSAVNARDSRFILVRALDRDRVIALRPVGVSLLRWIDWYMFQLSLDLLLWTFYFLSYRSKEPCPPLYSPGDKSPSELQCKGRSRIRG